MSLLGTDPAFHQLGPTIEAPELNEKKMMWIKSSGHLDVKSQFLVEIQLAQLHTVSHFGWFTVVTEIYKRGPTG